jgi:hypothetical protein
MLTAGRTFVAKSDDKTIDDKRGRSIKIPDKPASAVKIADINVQKSIKQVEREKEPYPAELSSDYDDNASDDQAQTGNSAQVSQQTMLDGLINSSTLPPRVCFITTSGEVGTSDVNLIAELCDNGGGIGDVTLFLNGIPITIDNNGRGLKAYPKNSLPGCLKFERTITLNNDRNFISLMAFNKGNTIESNRDNIELTTTLSAIKQPKLHILTVAVNNYQDGDLRLKYPLNDALDIDNTVRHHAESLFSKIITYTLHDKEVTKNNMAAVFSKIGATTNREDVFLLFLAGHGVTDEKSGIYYFLPVDFRYTGDDAVTSQGISMNDFKKYLTSINAMKSLILLDTCNSGSFTEAISSRGMTEKTAITKLTRAVGRATIAASSKNQVALEGYEGHGVFSYALLEGIKGKAASPDGQITINRLATFIEETLPLLTYKKWGYEQIPQKSLIGTDFQIGVK